MFSLVFKETTASLEKRLASETESQKKELGTEKKKHLTTKAKLKSLEKQMAALKQKQAEGEVSEFKRRQTQTGGCVLYGLNIRRRLC